MENTNNSGAEKNLILVKPYSVKEFSTMYGVSTKTFRKWLKPYGKQIGKKTGHFYMIEQVRKIFGLLGLPIRNQKPVSATPVLPLENPATKYVDAAWDFAHAALWSGKSFSAEEISLCKKSLHEFFTALSNGEKEVLIKRLSIFCQRVLLTRSYIDYKPIERTLPNPALWFDKNYEYGFAGTAKWMKQIAEERKRNPYHREELDILAGLFHEYIQSRSLSVMQTASAYLSGTSRIYLLRIFCNCISELNARPDYLLAA